MIKLKGTTIYPNAIVNVLSELEQVKDYIIVLQKDENELDKVVLELFCEENDLPSIKAFVKDKLKVSLSLQLLSKAEMVKKKYPEKNRKPISVLDMRNT